MENVDLVVNDKSTESAVAAILGKPKAFGKSMTPLYSRSQMIEMFRLGYLNGEKLTLAKDVERSVAPYTVLKSMSTGDSLLLPFEKWASARTAASTIKKNFGTIFRVSKVTTSNSALVVRVTRIS